MRKSVVWVIAALCLAATAACSGAAPKWKHRVVVKAVDTSYTEVPVSVTLDAPFYASMARLSQMGEEMGYADVRGRDKAGRGGKVEITWIVHDLPKGGSRYYDLEFDNCLDCLMRVGVSVDGGKEWLGVRLKREPLTRYYYTGAPKPYCWPIIGPTGKPVTRAYPMEKVAGESADHPHHRSMWFTHGSVNGQDFWSEGEGKGKTVHRAFETGEDNYALGRIRERNDWIAADGKKVCEDVRELRVYNVDRGRLMDFEITLNATEGPVTMGDTKEGMFGMRVADSMAVTRGSGHIVNSEGQRDKEAWGKRAKWCDYYGPVDGQTVGIAILDHPDNLQHPTYWHVRDYGLFAANPFGVHDFLGQKELTGEYTIAKGGSLTFRYRIFIHEGEAEAAGVASLYEQYAHPPVVRVY